MILASKTMAAIDAAMIADQGAAFRSHLEKLMPLAGDAYSTKQDDWRDHLGASLIGRECSRELWYSFHWATRKRFDGRMLRLFNRGHLEEPRMIAMLLTIGCKVWQVDEQGKQFRVDGHRGHFGGSLDGVALGILEAPDQPVLVEFKTHGEKSFLKLVAEGVMKAKWEHFIQMQIYMGKNSLQLALYMAVNKNTDDLHAELVQFDQREYDRALARSVAIIEAVEPPPKINPSPGFFKCKFCDHYKVCHLGTAPAVTCRSCVHAHVDDDGRWRCSEPMADAAFGDNIDLSPTAQREACPSYFANPVFSIKEIK